MVICNLIAVLLATCRCCGEVLREIPDLQGRSHLWAGRCYDDTRSRLCTGVLATPVWLVAGHCITRLAPAIPPSHDGPAVVHKRDKDPKPPSTVPNVPKPGTQDMGRLRGLVARPSVDEPHPRLLGLFL